MTIKNVSRLCQIKITPSWEWLDQGNYENLRNISFCTKYLKVYTFFTGGSKKKKNVPDNAGHTGSIPGLGRSPGEGNNPLQHSCLENPMDRGAWWATVHGVAK